MQITMIKNRYLIWIKETGGHNTIYRHKEKYCRMTDIKNSCTYDFIHSCVSLLISQALLSSGIAKHMRPIVENICQNVCQQLLRYEKKPLYKGFSYRMASTKGLEPLTVRLEGACSIQLSYVDISTA